MGPSYRAMGPSYKGMVRSDVGPTRTAGVRADHGRSAHLPAQSRPSAPRLDP